MLFSIRPPARSTANSLFAKVGLPAPKEAQYELRDTVRNLLKRPFPNPGDDIKITTMFNKHVDDGSLGIPQAHRDDGELLMRIRS